MKKFILFSSLVILLVLAGGTAACKKGDPALPPAVSNVSASGAQTAQLSASAAPATSTGTAARPEVQGRPQAKLPALKLWIGTNEIKAEIAQTLNQIQTGMMWRTNMAEMEGMLFVFPQARQVSFYMRNTLLPLSCAYIDPEGTILEIYPMTPLDETPIPSRSDQIQYVLEMNQGWFERHGIKPGVLVATERGTFPETFRRR